MANSRRGANYKFIHTCPQCCSKHIVKNGHHYGGKLQFLCKTCHKHFTIETAKGYPPTKIPFPIIAYILYFRRKIPEFSNMRKYRRFVNHWLKALKITDQDVSRQTLHHWINEFDQYLDKVITFEEARDFCHKRLEQLSKTRPPQKAIPYQRALDILERKYGKTTLLRLIKKDETFFKELVNIVSKQGVFHWEFFKGGDLDVSHGYRSLSTG